MELGSSTGWGGGAGGGDGEGLLSCGAGGRGVGEVRGAGLGGGAVSVPMLPEGGGGGCAGPPQAYGTCTVLQKSGSWMFIAGRSRPCLQYCTAFLLCLDVESQATSRRFMSPCLL
jgi:hypothetical protein